MTFEWMRLVVTPSSYDSCPDYALIMCPSCLPLSDTPILLFLRLSLHRFSIAVRRASNGQLQQ